MGLYDDDFYAWCVEQARLLRERRFDEIDLANIIEEIESLGRRETSELRPLLEPLIAHLLKWQMLSESRLRVPDWRATIREQRRKVARRLKENPSLRPQLPTLATEAFEDAIEAAIDQTGLPASAWPSECPWTTEQLLDRDFWPEDAQ